MHSASMLRRCSQPSVVRRSNQSHHSPPLIKPSKFTAVAKTTNYAQPQLISGVARVSDVRYGRSVNPKHPSCLAGVHSICRSVCELALDMSWFAAANTHSSFKQYLQMHGCCCYHSCQGFCLFMHVTPLTYLPLVLVIHKIDVCDAYRSICFCVCAL